jgi:Uma2 family endonuclease
VLIWGDVTRAFLTPEQYLEIERAAEFKSEYFQGEMFPMQGDGLAFAGAGLAHNRLVKNLVLSLGNQLRAGPCDLFVADMRVHVRATGLYTYPDIVLYCGEPQLLDDRRDTLLNPCALVEVLSPTTEAYDRGRKFENYQSIESLKEYLLVASDRIHVDLYTRQPDTRWLLTSASRLEESLDLPSVGCRLALSDLYENVEFV